jgi:hypothetical protein
MHGQSPKQTGRSGADATKTAIVLQNWVNPTIGKTHPILKYQSCARPPFGLGWL